jgi:hypothetical protein
MEGKIAGMDFEAVKKSGGSHGSTLIDKTLYVGLLNGSVVTYNLTTGKKSNPSLSERNSATLLSVLTATSTEDMADGHVLF